MKKEDFYRKDFGTFKPKYHLLCYLCTAEFPQKSLKTTEKRDKVINITEIKNLK